MVHRSGTLLKKRFHGLMRPMILKSSVRASAKEPRSTPCVQEMTAVMSCWKANTFDDIPCRKEIEAFVSCVERAKKEGKKKTTKERDGSTRYGVEELNKRMREFVWPH